MNKDMLEKVKAGKGFIAALDQSGGSTPILRPDDTRSCRDGVYRRQIFINHFDGCSKKLPLVLMRYLLFVEMLILEKIGLQFYFPIIIWVLIGARW
jgi:hypothetical protein